MKLQQVIHDIHEGRFIPDNPRRGYFADLGSKSPLNVPSSAVKVEDSEVEEEPVEQGEQLQGDDFLESSESSAESQADCGSDSEEEICPPPPKCYRHFARGPLLGKFVAHKTSKLVHYKDSLVAPNENEKAKALSCGRVLNENYVDVTEFETVAMCRRCKVNATKDNLSPHT